jgi:hypothetical protein
MRPSRYDVDRVTVRQRKTGHPVRLELSEQARDVTTSLTPMNRNQNSTKRAIYHLFLESAVSCSVWRYERTASGAGIPMG